MQERKGLGLGLGTQCHWVLSMPNLPPPPHIPRGGLGVPRCGRHGGSGSSRWQRI